MLKPEKITTQPDVALLYATNSSNWDTSREIGGEAGWQTGTNAQLMANNGDLYGNVAHHTSGAVMAEVGQSTIAFKHPDMQGELVYQNNLIRPAGEKHLFQLTTALYRGGTVRAEVNLPEDDQDLATPAYIVLTWRSVYEKLTELAALKEKNYIEYIKDNLIQA